MCLSNLPIQDARIVTISTIVDSMVARFNIIGRLDLGKNRYTEMNCILGMQIHFIEKKNPVEFG